QSLPTDNMQIVSSKKGFTLIELVLYIAIIAGFLTTTIFFAMRVVEGGQRARIHAEVQQNLRVAMERIDREIRSAVDLNVAGSTFNAHPGVLSLEGESGEDPIVFDIQGGILRLSKGASGPYNLTSNDVEVTNFVVKNHSVSNRTKVIQIEMTVRYASTADSVAYDVESSARTSVVLRTQSD
ncbi:type II secretion system GspH family protein, partial [Patescibacteria group bacterium]|nr:type II secretion system GspH family protein [Patescibacteria group bacterium]